MNAMCHTIGAMVTIAVFVNRTAWGSVEPQATGAPGAVVTTESAPSQPSSNLTFTPVVQRSLPVGPDYRGAISFATGTTPWWPKAAWIHTPRSEEIERQVGQWLELQKIDASGDENCGLVGHGAVAAIAMLVGGAWGAACPFFCERDVRAAALRRYEGYAG